MPPKDCRSRRSGPCRPKKKPKGRCSPLRLWKKHRLKKLPPRKLPPLKKLLRRTKRTGLIAAMNQTRHPRRHRPARTGVAGEGAPETVRPKRAIAFPPQSVSNDGALTLLKKFVTMARAGAIARFAESCSRAGDAGKAAQQLRSPSRAKPCHKLAEGEFYHARSVGPAGCHRCGGGGSAPCSPSRISAPPTSSKSPAIRWPEKGPKTFMVPMIPAAVLEWDEHRLVIAGAFAEE